MNINHLTALALMLLISACNPATEITAQQTLPTLQRAEPWVWQGSYFNNDTEVLPRKVGIFTLSLDADGRFSASTDCNAMGGSYRVDKTIQSITFGPIISTKMYCQNSQEQTFLRLLSEVNSYGFEDGKLLLQYPYDTGTAVFE